MDRGKRDGGKQARFSRASAHALLRRDFGHQSAHFPAPVRGPHTPKPTHIPVICARVQVSVCAAWSPDDIDGRAYDYTGLADASDFLYIMFYDTRSQVACNVLFVFLRRTLAVLFRHSARRNSDTLTHLLALSRLLPNTRPTHPPSPTHPRAHPTTHPHTRTHSYSHKYPHAHTHAHTRSSTRAHL